MRKLIHEIPEEYFGLSKLTKEQKQKIIKAKKLALVKIRATVSDKKYKSYKKIVDREIKEINDPSIAVDLGLGGSFTRIKQSSFSDWDKGYNKGVDQILRKIHAEVNKLIKKEIKIRSVIKKEIKKGKLPGDIGLIHDASLKGLKTYLRVIKNNISINRGNGEIPGLETKERYEMKFEKIGNQITIFSS